MPTAEPRFEERILRTPVRELQLTIAGTHLEPVLREVEREMVARRIRIRPRWYLADEWGVPFGSATIGIPFYLAHPELTKLHEERAGYVEGIGQLQLLRYLRHELGHAVNYAYRLYDEEEWVRRFGSMTQPYLEDYRPIPFSRRFVRHLPGWYAQKHPDEDWSETFAVWMNPGGAWRDEYREWPTALAKLEYCDRTMAALADRAVPDVTQELDQPVEMITLTAEQLYPASSEAIDVTVGLDGALKAIFEEFESHAGAGKQQSAAELLRRLRPQLAADIYRWTGHFPERTQQLVRRLTQRLEDLRQQYATHEETAAAVALTALVTALAMNHVVHGTYQPAGEEVTDRQPEQP